MKAQATSSLVGPLLQLFFAEHLVVHKRARAQTIACYRDTFRLLLQFMRDRTGIAPSALLLPALDADTILGLLDHIERDRSCSVRSRNNRLAAIRSFFRFVSLRDPTTVGTVTRIMAIPIKRYERKLVGYLNREEVKALLAAPDRTTAPSLRRSGYRYFCARPISKRCAVAEVSSAGIRSPASKERTHCNDPRHQQSDAARGCAVRNGMA
jgi:integrase